MDLLVRNGASCITVREDIPQIHYKKDSKCYDKLIFSGKRKEIRLKYLLSCKTTSVTIKQSLQDRLHCLCIMYLIIMYNKVYYNVYIHTEIISWYKCFTRFIYCSWLVEFTRWSRVRHFRIDNVLLLCKLQQITLTHHYNQLTPLYT